MDKTTKRTLAKIASRELGIETLETRNSDSLDFHENAVWSIEDALKAAFEAGEKAGAASVRSAIKNGSMRLAK